MCVCMYVCMCVSVRRDSGVKQLVLIRTVSPTWSSHFGRQSMMSDNAQILSLVDICQVVGTVHLYKHGAFPFGADCR